MTQPNHATQSTYVPPPQPARLVPVAPLTELKECAADTLPKLRVWASYPDGSEPESIEITYDGEGPVTVELIAGILRSLPGRTTQLNVVGSSGEIKSEALTRALNNAANRSLMKGNPQ